MPRTDSVFLQALLVDNSLPVEPAAVRLWLTDLRNPLRWVVRPLMQFFFAGLLYLVWFFKALPLPQFRAHQLLQRTICWFCRNFVSPEANRLILRHYATETNILNFLADNTPGTTISTPRRVSLYPREIDDMIRDSFVAHDQELFRLIRDLGKWQPPPQRVSASQLSWRHWQPICPSAFRQSFRRTQVIDFESAHALFMCLFCLLLTREEYRDAINGFNLDQSIALRIGQLIGDASVAEMAYNKFPLYIVGPRDLSRRFLMHGFFTEHVYARLETIRTGVKKSDLQHQVDRQVDCSVVGSRMD